MAYMKPPIPRSCFNKCAKLLRLMRKLLARVKQADRDVLLWQFETSKYGSVLYVGKHPADGLFDHATRFADTGWEAEAAFAKCRRLLGQHELDEYKARQRASAAASSQPYTQRSAMSKLMKRISNATDEEFSASNISSQDIANALHTMPGNQCDACGKSAKLKTMLKCHKCSATYYCGAECQRVHWKGGHKEVCHASDDLREGDRVVFKSDGEVSNHNYWLLCNQGAVSGTASSDHSAEYWAIMEASDNPYAEVDSLDALGPDSLKVKHASELTRSPLWRRLVALTGIGTIDRMYAQGYKDLFLEHGTLQRLFATVST
jgi:hypothetical protein